MPSCLVGLQSAASEVGSSALRDALSKPLGNVRIWPVPAVAMIDDDVSFLLASGK